MYKTRLLIILIFIGLLGAACQSRPESAPIPSEGIPEPSATTIATQPTKPSSSKAPTPAVQPFPSSAPEPATISGEFVLTNTTAGGGEVGVEAMAIVLEYRLAPAEAWAKIAVECDFDPSAPLVLKSELVVQYECRIGSQLPAEAQLRTTAEVKIFGRDQVYKLEVETK